MYLKHDKEVSFLKLQGGPLPVRSRVISPFVGILIPITHRGPISTLVAGRAHLVPDFHHPHLDFLFVCCVGWQAQ